ncbi:MAG: permease, partial [Aquificaceae bacterium]
VPVGTALAFMMATTALSLPEFIILKQIMKPRLIAMFATIVGVSIIVAGYLINFFFRAL